MCQFKCHSLTAFRRPTFIRKCVNSGVTLRPHFTDQRSYDTNWSKTTSFRTLWSKIQKSLFDSVWRLNNEDQWGSDMMGLEVMELEGFHPSDSDTSKIVLRQRFANKRSYNIRLEPRHHDCQKFINSKGTLWQRFADKRSYNTRLELKNTIVKNVSIQDTLCDSFSLINVSAWAKTHYFEHDGQKHVNSKVTHRMRFANK